MNGIIHAASHGNNLLSMNPSEDDIFNKLATTLEELISAIKPLRMIFIAVDGVAPRAKLNQQRTRRFRSARDQQEQIRLKETGKSRASESYFDSNCITPGTEFMHRLSKRIKAFIVSMLKESSDWDHLEVHYSGSETPGEGEHKIISYIRKWRDSVDYAPNTRHCIYGADADMIMLALATHEPYFLVLRDIPVTSSSSRSSGHGWTSSQASSSLVHLHKLQYVRIHILREYLFHDLLEDMHSQDVHLDMERLLDDFVFLTFLVGNDFLPHLPAIDIGDGAFDIIFDAYKTVFAASLGDDELLAAPFDLSKGASSGESQEPLEKDSIYLVNRGTVNASKLETIFALISVTELSLFENNELMKEVKAARKSKKLAMSPVPTSASLSNDQHPLGAVGLSEEEEYRWRYYKNKFGIDISTEEGERELHEIRRSYMTGLCWCLSYYTRGMWCSA